MRPVLGLFGRKIMPLPRRVAIRRAPTNSHNNTSLQEQYVAEARDAERLMYDHEQGKKNTRTSRSKFRKPSDDDEITIPRFGS